MKEVCVAHLIDGKAEATRVRENLAARIAVRKEHGGSAPGLVTILVGEDPASQVYVGRKQRESREIGMFSESAQLPADVSEDALVDVVRQYNERDDIHGILVQLPLPKGFDTDRVIGSIDPAKDVDGLTAASQGALFTGRPGLRPCTPSGCMHLLDQTGVDVSGKNAVVVGRSILVGRPVAMMLLERNATVTVAHSRTADLQAVVAAADILVVAVGVPGLVKGAWVKPGAVVLDVGMNRVDGKLCGDVDFEAACERAGWITPVPGGVGPMTVAMLLENTWRACLVSSGDEAETVA
ncbi:MAG: methylenetetrahydrofolate dehydrogenase (NADP+)/methenyltetrahydrofolate cyclohydrolase [Hyphomicrobiaceae bacterium]